MTATRQLKRNACLKPLTTLPSITSQFKWIISILLKFKFLSLMYTPAESARIVLVGSESQYGVKPNGVFQEDRSSNLSVPKVPPKRVKISFFFMLRSSYSICRVPSRSPMV